MFVVHRHAFCRSPLDLINFFISLLPSMFISSISRFTPFSILSSTKINCFCSPPPLLLLNSQINALLYRFEFLSFASFEAQMEKVVKVLAAIFFTRNEMKIMYTNV